MTEKGIVKKHVDQLWKKEIPIKDEIDLEVQLEKWDLHRKKTTINSHVTVYNPSQNNSHPILQKQLQKRINNVAQLANDNLTKPQPKEANHGSSNGGHDSNTVLR